MLLYYSQIHLNQVEYDDKREFARTATINILDFVYFNSLKYDKVIKVKSDEGDVCLEELEMQVIELPKFHYNSDKDLSRKEQWVSYLKGCDEANLNNILNKNQSIKRLDDLLEKYWETEKME